MFVNDGSKDKTWEIISDLAKKNKHYIGISQSRNRGHQFNHFELILFESDELWSIHS